MVHEILNWLATFSTPTMVVVRAELHMVHRNRE